MGEPLNITVMSGGQGPEREVSLRSGVAVMRALRSLGHSVTELDPIDDDTWVLPAGTQVVFLALHGEYGEDGQVQRQLQLLGMPYTGSGPKASELAYDKVRAKEALRAAGLTQAGGARLQCGTTVCCQPRSMARGADFCLGRWRAAVVRAAHEWARDYRWYS